MAEAATHNENQYLTFTLDRESFALDITSVREVLELVNITRVPRTPDFIRGVINLRGRAVPVVDLKREFGLGETTPTVNTCIIIVEVALDGEDTVLGALADSVQEVYEMDASQIEPPPRMGTPIKNEFIRGMGKTGEQCIIILEAGKVFTSVEMAGLGHGVVEAGPETTEA